MNKILKFITCAGIFSVFLFFSCNKAGKSVKEKSGKQDSLSEMISELTGRIETKPDELKNYVERARLFEKQNKYDNAIKDMITVVKTDSTSYEYYNYLGDLLFKAKAVKKAIESYQRSINLNPSNDYAFLKTGEIYLYMADSKKSLEYLGKALEINEYNPETYFFIAYNYMEKKDTAKALLNFQASVNADADYFDSYMNLGLIYAARRNNMAVDYYNNALRLKPGSIEVLYALGKYYQDVDDLEKAISYYKEILLQVADHKSTNYNMGYIYFRKGEYDKSIQFFSTAISKMPTYKQAYYGRALAYLKINNKDMARNDFEKIIELDPKDKEAANELKKLK